MNKLYQIAILAVCLLVGGLVSTPALAQTDTEARKARILANLTLQFPQLDSATVTMGDLGPSSFVGLDMGSFSFSRGSSQQTQRFLVTTDDTRLYLISGEPIDVSRSQAEIDAELARRSEEKQRQAAETRQELAAAVAGLPTRGNPQAAVTIVEFSDFQCPYCARSFGTISQILEKYGNDVKFVYKHFPLNFHPWAKPAAIAAVCAAEQQHAAFWTLHDNYFRDQKSLNPSNVLEKSREYLAGSNIDMTVWSQCAEDEESGAYQAAAATVDADMVLGQKLGVSGTPGFFVNGRFVNGAQPLSAFEPLIAEARKD